MTRYERRRAAVKAAASESSVSLHIGTLCFHGYSPLVARRVGHAFEHHLAQALGEVTALPQRASSTPRVDGAMRGSAHAAPDRTGEALARTVVESLLP